MTKRTKPKVQKSKVKSDGKNIKTYEIAILTVIIAVIIYFLFFQSLISNKNTNTEYTFKKEGVLTFIDSLGVVKTKIDIQIADNDYDRELGLMFRKSMQENRGMLFIFPKEDIQNFWMHNTYIPLDMIFVNAKNKIITIQNADKTLSDQTYSSIKPAKYVIEVNLGFSKKYGLKVGDKITWSKTQTNMDKNSN